MDETPRVPLRPPLTPASLLRAHAQVLHGAGRGDHVRCLDLVRKDARFVAASLATTVRRPRTCSPSAEARGRRRGRRRGRQLAACRTAHRSRRGAAHSPPRSQATPAACGARVARMTPAAPGRGGGDHGVRGAGAQQLRAALEATFSNCKYAVSFSVYIKSVRSLFLSRSFCGPVCVRSTILQVFVIS